MSARQRRILLVEDSPTDALIVKHALRNRFEVEHVRTPEEARPLLETVSFAAVVTDYCLPGSDGLQLHRWIMERRLDVPVIIMSGHGDERIAAEALKLGAYDYIVKSEESLSSMGVVIEQVLRRHELEQEAQVLQEIVAHASDAIITLRTDGTVLTANHATSTLFGYAPDEVAGNPLATLFPRERNETDLDRMLAAGASGLSWQGELSARRRDGGDFPVHVSTSVLRDRGGRIRCLIVIARDVTERRQFLDRLKRLSITDNLTGLYNHRFFHDRLQYEFVRARRYGNSLGCIMIDVDFFKSVNDTYGHLIGDEALKGIAELIAHAVRNVDIVARYGGEEFAVLLPNTDIEGTRLCAEHIWETIGTTDISTRQGRLRLTVSAGASTLTGDVDDEEELCRRADDALLAAKRRGRNNVCVWREIAPEEAPRRTGPDAAVPGERLGDFRRLVAPAKARYLEALRPLLESLTQRDPLLHRRASNVSIFAHELGRASGMDPAALASLNNAALIHVISRTAAGPASAPADAPDPLEEFMRDVRVLETEAEFARRCSDRFDGTGPADAPSGPSIPLGARILAVAEAYEALLAEVAERPALSEEQAIEELRGLAGKELDPEIVELLARTRRLPVRQR
jgi:diguanylate cyclase (GGDEF)-like protein/PAS domain S-box-containing protein